MTATPVINVLLVAGRDQESEWLTATLRVEPGIALAGIAPSLERALATLSQRRVDIILLDSAAPDAKQLDRLQTLAALPLGPAVILIVPPAEMVFVQQAMFAGARGFLLKPFTHEQLLDSLRQTHEVLMQQRQALTATTVPAPPEEMAEVLTLFSPKGGVGRTALATNLAIALHQETRKQVTLVDGDLRFGDVDIAINLIARKSVADVLAYVAELEPALIESALTDHPSGIRVLLAPPYFDPTLEQEEDRLADVIKTLAIAQNGYIIVDAPSDLNESTLNLLDVSRRIVLVTSASVAMLRATKRFLELARKMDYPEHKIVLVVSGYRKDDIPIDSIEHHLGWPTAAVVASDPAAMALALNQGQPIVLRDRNHPISKAVFKLARYLGAMTAGGASQSTGDGKGPLAAPDQSGATPPIARLRPDQALGS
jgi:pilus assembly protein CpaE